MPVTFNLLPASNEIAGVYLGANASVQQTATASYVEVALPRPTIMLTGTPPTLNVKNEDAVTCVVTVGPSATAANNTRYTLAQNEAFGGTLLATDKVFLKTF